MPLGNSSGDRPEEASSQKRKPDCGHINAYEFDRCPWMTAARCGKVL
jgi:hypothetical protein